jgi:MraZ protein
MFIGRYYHTIEERGRVSLPKKFRDQERLWVVTRGLDGGLFLFPKATFEAELEKLANFTITKKAHRDLVRYLTNDAEEIEADKAGRVLLPEYLRATAQLAKNIVVVGSFRRIEIWDVEKYHQYLETLGEHAEEIAEEVGRNE